MLEPGLECVDDDGTTRHRHRLVSPLGEGGQAWIWRAASSLGTDVAIKWFRPQLLQRDPGLERRLRDLLAMGAPAPAFLWPEAIVRSEQRAGIGYRMPILPADFVSLDALWRPETPALHPRTEAQIAIRFVAAFARLHSREGCAYRDINKYNLVFRIADGAVHVLDNDNVSVNGEPSVMRGFPGFIAPEIERDPQRDTTRESDLHALAVYFFRLIMRGDPLAGQRALAPYRSDAERRAALYADTPLFVFDPRDDRNAPVPGRHDQMRARWAYQPRVVKEAFTQAFTDGLQDPAARVSHSRWRLVLSQCIDGYFECGACTAQHVDEGAATPTHCWHCHRPLYRPLRLRVRRPGRPEHSVCLTSGAALYAHHASSTAAPDYDTPLARWEHAARVLHNVGTSAWTVVGGGTTQVVAPGARVPLAPGTLVQCGAARWDLAPEAA